MKAEIHWGRIGIEGVVIVFSVLVALSADAWWDGRKEEERLRTNLETLLEDAEQNASILERERTAAQSQMDAAAELSERLGARAPGDRDAIVELLVRAMAISSFAQVTQGYEQVVAAGDLRNLPPNVRRSLADWMQSLVVYRDYIEAQGIQRRLLQYEAYYIDVVGVREILLSVRDDLPLGQVRFPVDVEALSADRRLDSLLAYRIIFAANQVAALGRSRERLRALEEDLRRELASLR